jgi:hypothetical protein
MKYSEISHGFAMATLLLALMYVMYAVWCDRNTDVHPGYRRFAREIYARLDHIPELDEVEKHKIEDKIQELVQQKEAKRTRGVAKACVIGAARGCLTGLVAGTGVEEALVGGAVFGAMAPVILGIESLMS